MKRLSNLRIAAAAVGGALVLASSASAVELSNIDYHYAKRAYSGELKPLPLLLNAIPGAGAVGLGGEAFVSDQVSVFADGTYLDTNLSQDVIRDAKKRSNDPIPDNVTAYNAALGSRYYTAFTGDSWYLGGQVAYADSRGDWTYEDATLRQRSRAWQPGVNFGYRWVWESGFLVRLGGTAAANIVQKSDVTPRVASANAQKGKDKLTDIVKVPAVGALDLGLGWAF